MWSRFSRARSAIKCVEPASFQQVHRESEERPHGAGSSIPTFLDAAITFSKDSSREEIEYKNRSAGFRLLQLFEATKAEDAKIKQAMPEHVKMVQGHWNCGLLLKLTELANHPDKHLRENLTFGHPTEGQTQASSVWRKREDAEELLKNMLEESEYRNREPTIRKLPPSFAHPKDLEKLWDETQEMVKWGWLKPIKKPLSMPVYGFPVLQGGVAKKHACGWEEHVKVRHCFDFRMKNRRCPEVEKMRLLSNRTVIEIIGRMLSKGHKSRAPTMQIKRDVSADVITETLLMNAKHNQQAALQVKKGMIWQPQEVGIAKRDFRKWYLIQCKFTVFLLRFQSRQ